MLADFHMHTTFSSDADENSTPERMIEAAIQKGLQAICITDHQDLDVGKNDEFQINFEAYFKTLRPCACLCSDCNGAFWLQDVPP